jgi:hypothetical protein
VLAKRAPTLRASSSAPASTRSDVWVAGVFVLGFAPLPAHHLARVHLLLERTQHIRWVVAQRSQRPAASGFGWASRP